MVEAKTVASELIGILTERHCKQKHLVQTAMSNQFDSEHDDLGSAAHPHPLPVSLPPLANANRKAPATNPMYLGGMVFDRSFDAAGSIVTTLKPGSRGKKAEIDALAVIAFSRATFGNPADCKQPNCIRPVASCSHRCDAERTIGYGESRKDCSIRL